MTHYWIHFCEACEMKAEISVYGEVWCPCNRKMVVIGEMEDA